MESINHSESIALNKPKNRFASAIRIGFAALFLSSGCGAMHKDIQNPAQKINRIEKGKNPSSKSNDKKAPVKPKKPKVFFYEPECPVEYDCTDLSSDNPCFCTVAIDDETIYIKIPKA